MSEVAKRLSVDAERRERCNIVLVLLQQIPRPVPQQVEDELVEFCSSHKNPISRASARRYLKRLPKSERDGIVAQFIDEALPKVLSELTTVPSTHVSVRDKIRRIIETGETPARDDVAGSKERSTWASERSASYRGSRFDALHRLLEINAEHFDRIRGVDGEYYGYRRSATHGDIIRFHIKIEHDDESGLLTFENRYRRDGQHWRVRGFGFSVDGIVYLVGHAISETRSSVGLGLRCFALKKYSLGGWLMGPLLSVDRFGHPLGARIVLIPADQHRSGRDDGTKDTPATVSEMIEDPNISPESLDMEIELKDVHGMNVFKDIPCSMHIQALIWNGTFTTLRGRQKTIDKIEGPAYRQLFRMQRDVLKLMRFSQDSIGPFFRIAAKYEDIFPGDQKFDDPTKG